MKLLTCRFFILCRIREYIYIIDLPGCLTHTFIMAAPVRSSDTSVPSVSAESTVVSGAENVQIQYSVLLDHLIGDKRKIKDLNPSVMGGLPSPHKTDEQKMIERGMESCAFKATLACVGGNEIITTPKRTGIN